MHNYLIKVKTCDIMKLTREKFMVKKKIFSFMVAIICLISCAVGLSGCRKMDRYLAVVPTDISYDATLTYHSEDTNYNYDKEWRVIRKPATICGAERDIIKLQHYYVSFHH